MVCLVRYFFVCRLREVVLMCIGRFFDMIVMFCLFCVRCIVMERIWVLLLFSWMLVGSIDELVFVSFIWRVLFFLILIGKFRCLCLMCRLFR